MLWLMLRKWDFLQLLYTKEYYVFQWCPVESYASPTIPGLSRPLPSTRLKLFETRLHQRILHPSCWSNPPHPAWVCQKCNLAYQLDTSPVRQLREVNEAVVVQVQ